MRKLSNDCKNFIWNVIGLTAYCGISFLLLVVVNNINEPNTAGIFSYSFSICTLFFYVSLFFNRTFQIASNKYSFNQFLGTRLITSLISIIAIVIFSLISGFSFNKVLIIFFIMLYRIVDAISDCFYGYFQDSNKLYIVGISYTIKAIFSLIVFVISEILTKNLYLSLLLFLIINLLVLLIYDVRQYKNISKAPKIEYDFSCFLQITKKTFPIFILQFVSIYLVNSPKYIITYFTSDELQAIFGVLIIPATILSLVGNYLIQPFVKRLNDYRIEKKY